MALKFSPREQATLAALADTFVPATPDLSPLRESASELGVPARLEETLRDVLAPEAGRDFRLLLRLLDSSLAGLALVGRPARFSALDPAVRERVLLALADSNVALKRQMFVGAKKLVAFLAYSDARTWRALDYRAPPADAEPAHARPALPEWTGEAREFDAIIIGSGAGGGVAAGILAKAGWSVLVVEQAPLRGGRDFNGDEAQGNRDLYEGAGAFATRDQSIAILAGRAAGGGTTVNWMTSLAPPAWLRAEWEAAGVTGATGPEFDAHVRAVEARAHVDTDESDANGANAVLRDGATKLGWKEGADWRVLPRNAKGCASRCDFCTFGCPWDAKQGTLVTWLADAAAAGARFLFGARVERVVIERGVAAGITLADGREVRAKRVLLAGGAVQTAALLLRSGVKTRGIGRLFLHPVTSVAGIFERKIEMWRGPPQTIVIDKFHDLDGAHHGALLEAAPGHPGLTASALPWRSGAEAKRDMLRIGHTAGLIVLARDTGAGRVRVGPRGEPAVDYRITRADEAHLKRGMKELARVERAAGAVGLSTLATNGMRIEADPKVGALSERQFDDFCAGIDALSFAPHRVGLFTAHQMGTCALGRDGVAPADGETGRVWDVEGLYVLDGSAFPTPSGVNPMISIQTLAHRTASRLASSAR
ncbi:MAG: GMC family oxidoreductase N-terminal domain-containing protein [Thermoplasmatota archaeon]